MVGYDIPGLRSGGRDAHRTIAAVDTLHLKEGTLLVLLVAEPDKAIATRLTGHSVGHYLGRLARRETSLEKGDKNELVDLGTEIANEDAKLGATVIAGLPLADSLGYRTESSTYRRSTRPPPEAQFSLKTRCELGTGVPFRARAFCAASGVGNSMKQ